MTILQQVIDVENLTIAWDAVAENDGIPGTDSVSIVRWRRNWEERLVKLAQEVKRGSYHPHKLRIRRIPKRSAAGFRVLRIPTVTDRVLQRAALQVLMPLFEREFLDCSFGYRPGRGLKNAVERIVLLRENGYQHVLDADIDAFFDSVDHELLLRFLESDLPDNSLLPLIRSWLQVGATSEKHTLGIPQGSPISPLFANVYLHRFDKALERSGANLIRYADDFLVLCSCAEKIEQTRALVERALWSLDLRLEMSKTKNTNFEEGFKFLGVHFLRDTYSYAWEDKKIIVKGDDVDWLFSRYGGSYE